MSPRDRGCDRGSIERSHRPQSTDRVHDRGSATVSHSQPQSIDDGKATKSDIGRLCADVHQWKTGVDLPATVAEWLAKREQKRQLRAQLAARRTAGKTRHNTERLEAVIDRAARTSRRHDHRTHGAVHDR